MISTTAQIPLAANRDAAAIERSRSLTSAVRGLRSRVGMADNARPLLFIGGLLIPLGFVFILLGWAGAAGTVNLYEQIPYSISGGMLGVGMVFAGGFTYFAYWLTQLVYATRAQAADTRVIREHLEALVASGASLAAAGPVLAQSEPFVATATGTMLHHRTCPTVSGRQGLREVASDEDGLTACKICSPSSFAPSDGPRLSR